MSMLDSYRRNVFQKNNELARLQQDKAKDQGRLADVTRKINDANQAINRATSQSTIKSKMSEIQRYQNDLTSISKRVADLESKIARKQQEVYAEQKKVSDEETKEQKKRISENQRQERDHTDQMSQINQTLKRHSYIQRETNARLEQLQRLPERIVVLFLAADPIDQVRLRLDEEARVIQDMFRKAEHRDSIRFETRWAVQPKDLLQAMNELQPTIVHFSGHGSDDDQIIFLDSAGNAKPVSKEAIVQTMTVASDNLRLVFFNTCYSFNQASAVTQHIEAAIGMNTSIGDEAARIFASQFYSALGFGFSLAKAFKQAKAALMLESIPEDQTPELFIQEGLDAQEIVIVRP